MALFYVTYLWASTKIVLDHDKLKTYIPRYFFLIHSSYLNTAEISQIVVQTTTPLIPDKTSISQINWRDKIHIVSSNQKFVVIVPLFIFPKAKAVILELIAQNPTISIVFTKNTIMENINKSIK